MEATPNYAPVPPLFDDREDAGRRLSTELAGRPDLAGGNVIVVGLARGGVPVAAEVARSLGAPLGVLAVRKVGHPLQPEFALGAVTPGGVYLRETAGLTDEEIARVVDRAIAQAEEKAARLAAIAPPPDPAGAVCLIVDDGLATGATLIAAARWARANGAARVIAAVPVASSEGASLIESEVDAVVCPYVTDAFWAVSVWYRRFEQVEDTTVEAILRDVASGAEAT
jgi:predicted phosphoribosyltransferase